MIESMNIVFEDGMRPNAEKVASIEEATEQCAEIFDQTGMHGTCWVSDVMGDPVAVFNF